MRFSHRTPIPEDPSFASHGFEPGEDKELDLAEYLLKIRNHWRLIAVLVLLCVTVGVVFYFITPKQFLARSTIQIERRSFAAALGSNNPWLENWWNLEFYPTQERLLASRGLAEKVVLDLRLAEDRAFAALRPEDSSAGSATAAAELDKAEVARLAMSIRGGLRVERVQNTQLFELSYVSTDPERAARLVNGFAYAFIDLGIESRGETAGKASGFLTNQIATLRREIQDRELALQEVSRETDIVAVEPQSNVTQQRLRALNQDFIEAMRARIEKEARYQEQLARPAETVAEAHSGREVTNLRGELLKLEDEYQTKLNTFKPEWPQMQELAARIEQARQTYHAAVANSAAQVRETAQAEYQAALRQERALDGEIRNLKAQTVQERSTNLDFINLENEISTRRQLLNDLLLRQSEAAVSAQGAQESNVRIVDQALVPSGPFRPSLRQNASLGLVVGLVLGVGLAFLIEYLDRTVKGAEELERLIGLPTLAVIPDLLDDGRSYGYLGRYGYGYGHGEAYGEPKNQGSGSRRWLDKKGRDGAVAIELLPHAKPKSAVAEAYRSLRTALMLASAEELKVIAITSAEAGEGKTSTASNLAVVMAQLGRNVLLVDGDLRKPRQHTVFRVSNRTGLVNHLTGGAEIESVLGRTAIDKLYLCPSGPIPPNPSELLSSERMREFVQAVRGRFDFVIFDTPPALPVTDSTLMGALTDGVVLCCRAGRLQRDEARAVRDRLLLSDVRVLGTVLNFYRSGGSGYGSGRKYRYYESYGDAAEETRAHSAA